MLTYADCEDAELDGHGPTVVHVDTANRAVDPALVPGGRRRVELPAGGPA